MFADNHRISRIQMERQYLLAYLGPAVLWIGPGLQGRNGFFSVIAGTLILCIWMFFLMRQVHVYRYPERYWGKIMSRVIALGYESYLIFTGGWLVANIGKILREYMIQGIPLWLAAGLFVLAALGSSGNLQERGRFAQTAWPAVGWIVGLMLLIAAFQGVGSYGQKTQGVLSIQEAAVWNWDEIEQIVRGSVFFAAALLGTVLIPFLEVENDSNGEHSASRLKMIGKITLWVLVISVLLQAAFGSKGAETLEYPVLNLMAGVKIPGGFIRRIDMIFLTAALFALMFSLGSIFFYGRYILERTGILTAEAWWSRILAAVLCFLLGTVDFGQWQLIREYPKIVCFIYLPVFLVLTFCNALLRRKRYGK